MQTKKYLLSFIILLTVASWANFALAQTSGADYAQSGVGAQIEQFLCAPTKPTPSQQDSATNRVTDVSYQTSGARNQASSDLYNCINRLYSFAILISSVVGVFFIVIAGYLYINAGGNDESISKAKNILVTTITALVILFGGYVLLKAINPDIIQFRSIQPPSVRLQPALSPGEGGVDTSAPPQTVTGSTQQLGQQVLALHNSGKIILASNHASGNTDNANALQNIKDTSDGKTAQRSSYQDGSLKTPGGTTSIDPQVLQAIISLEAKFGKFTISEIAGGAHSNNSDHYTGRAFDVSQINGSGVNSSHPKFKDFMNECTRLGAKLVLGPGNTGHSTHIHCSWSSGGPASNQPTTTNTNSQTQTAGAACLFSGVNLCQPTQNPLNKNINTTDTCGSGIQACKNYTQMIEKQATGKATVAVLKSIMAVESRCDITKSTQVSFGLMQMGVATANTFKGSCGVSDNITSDWLKNPSNAEKSICLAAAYINWLAVDSRCGSNDIRNVLAGYSAPAACNNSVNCSKETSCGGGPKKAWECLYDNNEHTVCNGDNQTILGGAGGYNETRYSVLQKLYCMQNPGF